jgi:hypothetical protein
LQKYSRIFKFSYSLLWLIAKFGLFLMWMIINVATSKRIFFLKDQKAHMDYMH